MWSVILNWNGRVVPASDVVCRSVAYVPGFLWRFLEACPGVEVVSPEAMVLVSSRVDSTAFNFARSTTVTGKYIS